jgi:hypothetical protein
MTELYLLGQLQTYYQEKHISESTHKEDECHQSCPKCHTHLRFMSLLVILIAVQTFALLRIALRAN